MVKPYWAGLSGKQKHVITNFAGLNTETAAIMINDSEAADMKNIDAEGPSLAVRKAREFFLETKSIAPSSAPIALGSVLLKNENSEKYEEFLSVIANHYWYYYDPIEGWVKISTGTHFFYDEGMPDMTFFVDRTIACGDAMHKAYYFDVNKKTSIVTSELDSEKQIPWCSFLVSHANRLYAARSGKNYLYAGGLLSPELWQSLTDGASFEFETPDSEGCSGIASFADRIIFFKPHHMYEIFGTDPLIGYQTSKIGDSIGCVSYRSIKEVSSCLLWLGDNAVYIYSGGSNPKNIGKPIQKYLDNIVSPEKACAGVLGHRYYLSLPQKEGRILLVYNLDTNEWYCEDSFNVSAFHSFKDELYALSEDGIYKMVSDEKEDIEWFWLSKCFSSDSPSVPHDTQRLYLTVEKPESTELSVTVFNNTGQKDEASLSVFSDDGSGSDDERFTVYRIDIPFSVSYSADWLQFKISGKGKCKIYALERVIRKRKGSW